MPIFLEYPESSPIEQVVKCKQYYSFMSFMSFQNSDLKRKKKKKPAYAIQNIKHNHTTNNSIHLEWMQEESNSSLGER